MSKGHLNQLKESTYIKLLRGEEVLGYMTQLRWYFFIFRIALVLIPNQPQMSSRLSHLCAEPVLSLLPQLLLKLTLETLFLLILKIILLNQL